MHQCGFGHSTILARLRCSSSSLLGCTGRPLNHVRARLGLRSTHLLGLWLADELERPIHLVVRVLPAQWDKPMISAPIHPRRACRARRRTWASSVGVAQGLMGERLGRPVVAGDNKGDHGLGVVPGEASTMRVLQSVLRSKTFSSAWLRYKDVIAMYYGDTLYRLCDVLEALGH